MTAQYYLWYMLVLPIVAINSKAAQENTKIVWFWGILWALGQIYWGINADAFENHGKATIPQI